jgi:hypothetical protein
LYQRNDQADHAGGRLHKLSRVMVHAETIFEANRSHLLNYGLQPVLIHNHQNLLATGVLSNSESKSLQPEFKISILPMQASNEKLVVGIDYGTTGTGKQI